MYVLVSYYDTNITFQHVLLLILLIMTEIRLDLFRRNESTNQWKDAPEDENDNNLLAISREEFEGEPCLYV